MLTWGGELRCRRWLWRWLRRGAQLLRLLLLSRLLLLRLLLLLLLSRLLLLRLWLRL